MTKPIDTNLRPDAVSWMGIGLVALAAAILSFSALMGLAVRTGTSPYLAWLFPISIDATVLVGARVWLTGRAPGQARKYAMVLALSAIGLTVSGNITEHVLRVYLPVPPWQVVVAVASVAPILLGAIAHLIALLTKRVAPRQESRPDKSSSRVETPAPQTAPYPRISAPPLRLDDESREVASKSQQPVGHSTQSVKVDRSDEVVREEIRDLAKQLGKRPGRAKVQSELGIGGPRADRLLKQVYQPSPSLNGQAVR